MALHPEVRHATAFALFPSRNATEKERERESAKPEICSFGKITLLVIGMLLHLRLGCSSPSSQGHEYG